MGSSNVSGIRIARGTRCASWDISMPPSLRDEHFRPQRSLGGRRYVAWKEGKPGNTRFEDGAITLLDIKKGS